MGRRDARVHSTCTGARTEVNFAGCHSHENTLTCIRIAEPALAKGHSVNLVASADGA
jgi:hypothetical protein